jgi:hypothetical protein
VPHPRPKEAGIQSANERKKHANLKPQALYWPTDFIADFGNIDTAKSI